MAFSGAVARLGTHTHTHTHTARRLAVGWWGCSPSLPCLNLSSAFCRFSWKAEGEVEFGMEGRS